MFRLIYHNFSQDLLLDLSLNEALSLSDDFFYLLFHNLDLVLMVHLLGHLFDLVYNRPYRHISVCLNLNWNLFVVDKMLGL
jgi:hypothetical protein